MAKTFIPTPKDPRDVVDYPIRWEEAEADPILSATVQVMGDNASDLTVEDTQVQTPVVISRVSGGIHGVNYRIECEVVLTSGQRFNREVVLKVRDL